MSDEEILKAKKVLRKKMRHTREEMDPDERERLSHKIVQKVLAFPAYRDAKSVMAYASMPEEVQLHELFDDCLAHGKELSIPLISGSGTMRPVKVPNADALEMGDFGILTVRPSARSFADETAIECIIVPGAAFDVHGHRLGLGGGYYDRFLKKIPGAKKIALAYDFQIVEDLPVMPYDSDVDVVITPERIIDPA